MPPVDASSTTTPNLWSTLPSTSVLASKRKETVQKGFSIVHHEPGDARLSHSAIRLFRESSDYVTPSSPRAVPPLQRALSFPDAALSPLPCRRPVVLALTGFITE